MICQKCKQSPATVHVVLVPESWTLSARGPDAAVEQLFCELCAQSLGLPSLTASKPSVGTIFQLLQLSQLSSKQAIASCPGCGLTLIEFRQRGRLGCAKCYEIFHDQLAELLERVHGATRHVGRIPGLNDEELVLIQRRNQLERDLEDAIRNEAYEQAAKLRDELKGLREP